MYNQYQQGQYNTEWLAGELQNRYATLYPLPTIEELNMFLNLDSRPPINPVDPSTFYQVQNFLPNAEDIRVYRRQIKLQQMKQPSQVQQNRYKSSNEHNYQQQNQHQQQEYYHQQDQYQEPIHEEQKSSGGFFTNPFKKQNRTSEYDEPEYRSNNGGNSFMSGAMQTGLGVAGGMLAVDAVEGIAGAIFDGDDDEEEHGMSEEEIQDMIDERVEEEVEEEMDSFEEEFEEDHEFDE